MERLMSVNEVLVERFIGVDKCEAARRGNITRNICCAKVTELKNRAFTKAQTTLQSY